MNRRKECMATFLGEMHTEQEKRDILLYTSKLELQKAQ